MNSATENQTSITRQETVHHSIPRAANIALVTLVLLVTFVSGFLVFYATLLHPAELAAQAASVRNTLLTRQAQGTATNMPQSLYTQLTNKPPTFSNSMNTPMGGWDTGILGNGSCTFQGGTYNIHVSSNSNSFYCLNSERTYSNFVFQVQMTILNGVSGGLLLRSAKGLTGGYAFDVTKNGFYHIEVIHNSSGGQRPQFGRDVPSQSDLKQSKLLTVIARGKHFLFYINKKFISSFDDSTFSTGLIGLAATNPENRNDVEVAFTNAQLWIV